MRIKKWHLSLDIGLLLAIFLISLNLLYIIFPPLMNVLPNVIGKIPFLSDKFPSTLKALEEYLDTRFSYRFEYANPERWVIMYCQLLFFGFIPAFIGLVWALSSIRAKEARRTACLALILNLGFFIPALTLIMKLFDVGYFKFVIKSMPLFLDLG